VEEVAVLEPVVAMEEVQVMVGLGLEVGAVAIMHMVVHMEQEGVDIQEVAMEHMVGVALVDMEGEQEDMEEVVAMVAVAMVDMVDQDMGVVRVVHMEGMVSMVEDQGGQEDPSQSVMKVKAIGR
jgi:hypothetical protein